MHVYKAEYREYEYQFSVAHGYSDYFLTPIRERHFMADNSLGAVDVLRLGGGRIEVASIERICKVDNIKK